MTTLQHRWMRAGALGAVLLSAPAPVHAQRIAIAPSFQTADPAAASAVSVDALLDQSTAALMEQVRMLTEPGRGLGNETVHRPCATQPQAPEMAIARMRPDAPFTAAVWRVRAWQAIHGLNQPLPVCFVPNRDEPDRGYRNVIRFNADWLARQGRGRSYVLRGYTYSGESPATLGHDRARFVCRASGANLQPRLIPENGGPSGVEGDARWVHYDIPTRPASSTHCR